MTADHKPPVTRTVELAVQVVVSEARVSVLIPSFSVPLHVEGERRQFQGRLLSADLTPAEPEPRDEPVRWFPSMDSLKKASGGYAWPDALFTRANARFWANFYSGNELETDVVQLAQAFGSKIERYASDYFVFDGERRLMRLPWPDGQSGISCVDAIVETYEELGRYVVIKTLAKLKIERRLADGAITATWWRKAVDECLS